MASKKAALFWTFLIAMAFSVAWYTQGNDLDLDSKWETEDLAALKYQKLDQDSKNELLYKAVDHNNTDLVRLLLENGANINAKNKQRKTPPFKSGERTSVNKASEKLLLIAAEKNNFEMAKLLLENGANVNFVPHDCTQKRRGCYNMPLWEAIQNNNFEMAKYFIENGAIFKNKGWKKMEGWKPLEFAITQRNLPILQLLIDNGANANAEEYVLKYHNGMQSTFRVTILYTAVNYGNIEAMRLLIKSGANVNAEILDGAKTILQEAVNQGNIEAVKILVENGAERWAKNKGGKTASDIAFGRRGSYLDKDHGKYELILNILEPNRFW